MAAVYFPINNFYFCFRKYCIATLKKKRTKPSSIIFENLKLIGFFHIILYYTSEN